MALRASFFVRGHPKAQRRAQGTVLRGKGGRVILSKEGRPITRVFNPGSTDQWKAAVALAGKDYRPPTPWEGPVGVSMAWLLPRPKRLMRKKDPDGLLLAESGPDVDNLAKAVLDALSQDGWWRDDRQVVAASLSRLYHTRRGIPGMAILIQSIQRVSEALPRCLEAVLETEDDITRKVSAVEGVATQVTMSTDPNTLTQCFVRDAQKAAGSPGTLQAREGRG